MKHPREVVLVTGGARRLGWYVTEPGANTFPRLPVRMMAGGALVVLAHLEVVADPELHEGPDEAEHREHDGEERLGARHPVDEPADADRRGYQLESTSENCIPNHH